MPSPDAAIAGQPLHSTTATTSARSLLTWAVPLVLLAGVLVRAEILARPMVELSARFLIDDSFISLDIARSIGTGHGPAAAARLTNGFQPLWVLLTAPIYAVLGESSLTDVAVQDLGVKLALGLGVVCDLVLVGAVLFTLRRRYGPTSPAVFLAATYWALSPRVWESTFNGLETVLALALFHVLWAWREHLPRTAGSPGKLGAVTGALCAALLLARIDQAIALGVFFVLALPRFRDRRFLVAAVLAFAVPTVLWSLWIHGWTGLVYPVSGEASRLQSQPSPDFLPRVAYHLRVVWAAVVLPATGLLVAGLFATVWAGLSHGLAPLGRLARAHAFHLATVALTMAAYVLYQGGRWYFRRYLVLFDWAAVLWLAGVLDLLVREAPRRRLVLQLGAVTAGAAFMVLHPSYALYMAVASPETTEPSYRGVALWARESFRPGTVVGAVQSGALGYYATALHVINMDGVTNPAALQAIKDKHLVAYVLAEKVAYVLGPRGNYFYVRDLESDPALKERLQAIGEGPPDGLVPGPWFVFSTQPDPR